VKKIQKCPSVTSLTAAHLVAVVAARSVLAASDRAEA